LQKLGSRGRRPNAARLPLRAGGKDAGPFRFTWLRRCRAGTGPAFACWLGLRAVVLDGKMNRRGAEELTAQRHPQFKSVHDRQARSRRTPFLRSLRYLQLEVSRPGRSITPCFTAGRTRGLTPYMLDRRERRSPLGAARRGNRCRIAWCWKGLDARDQVRALVVRPFKHVPRRTSGRAEGRSGDLHAQISRSPFAGMHRHETCSPIGYGFSLQSFALSASPSGWETISGWR